MNEQKKTVLVVEDDEDIRYSVCLILESININVLAAGNGQEALDIIGNKPLPDLILLDMLMPVMNGWTFAAQFREKYGLATPILVMTAASDAAKRADDVDASSFVSKPFSVDSLIEKVERYTLANKDMKAS
jgi:CheY-like chemotaxis protein